MVETEIQAFTRVRMVGTRPGDPDYDEGEVVERIGDAAIVRWHVAKTTYTEAIEQLEQVPA